MTSSFGHLCTCVWNLPKNCNLPASLHRKLGCSIEMQSLVTVACSVCFHFSPKIQDFRCNLKCLNKMSLCRGNYVTSISLNYVLPQIISHQHSNFCHRAKSDLPIYGRWEWMMGVLGISKTNLRKLRKFLEMGNFVHLVHLNASLICSFHRYCFPPCMMMGRGRRGHTLLFCLCCRRARKEVHARFKIIWVRFPTTYFCTVFLTLYDFPPIFPKQCTDSW